MKNFKYLLLIFLSFGLVNCESELEVEPAQSVSIGAALGSADGVKKVLIGAYAEAGQSSTFGGYSQIISELLGNDDEVSWEGTFLAPRQFYTKSMLSDNSFVGSHWVNSYEVINQANLVLDNASKIDDATERATVEGEALFLRAMTYFDMVRFYGGVPLRTAGVTNYGADLDIERASADAIYAQVASDLNDAYIKLPASNGEFADKYAAKALLARVHLQLGNYAEALTAANDVLANSGHSLASSFAGAFNNDSDSSEDIFAFQVTSQDGSNALVTHYAAMVFGGRGGDIVVDTYRSLFDSALDVRRGFFYISPDSGAICTYKYTNEYGNVPTLRIGEMHLIRAEANFRLGSSTGLAPLTEINALRARSGAPAHTALTLDLIFNERQLELGFEGHILHDKKRFGKSILGLPSNSPKLVLPIPQSEMDSNSLMVQNSGY